MTQHKKDHSGESARVLLKKIAQELKDYEKRVGPIPKMHAAYHEAQFRNHLRMRKSAA